MGDALKNLDRDIIYSVCNGAGFTNGYTLAYPEAEDHARGLSYISNLWRSGGDTENSWKSVVANGFTQNRWRHLTGPGHWNDPDMMLLGWIGWGEEQHPTTLTADEQYSHMSLWCLLSAPLLLGCDLTKLDEFTLNLLTNDEVLEVDQDPLGKQGEQIQLSTYGIALVKELEDGSKAVGFFNMGAAKDKFQFRLNDIGIKGKQKIRDLWRQKDLGEFENIFETEVNGHGVVMVKIVPVK
jgi:alpha-galactosidase